MLSLVRESGVATNHETADHARQVRRQALGDTVDKILLLRIATDIGEGQHHYGKTRGRERAGYCAALCSRSILDHGISAHGASDILEGLFAQIGKLDSDFATDLFVGGRRDADAPGFGDALKPCCDIHAITENIIALNEDVAEVDPNPEQHPPVFWDTVIALGTRCGARPFLPARPLPTRPHRPPRETQAKCRRLWF